MGSSSGGDPEQKHGEQHAAGMMMGNGSDSYNDDAPSEEWQSSSPSSTRQMLSRRRRFTPVAFVRKIDWGSLWDKAKEWIRNPMNMALLVWIVAVGGVRGHPLHGDDRDAQPRAADEIAEGHMVRGEQPDPECSLHSSVPVPAPEEVLPPGAPLPVESRRHAPAPAGLLQGRHLQAQREEAHHGGALVVLLLHLNCLAQYALCGLNLGYRRPERCWMCGTTCRWPTSPCAAAAASLGGT